MREITEHESDGELPRHITHFLLIQKEEKVNRILEREALNELFDKIEPQYSGIQNINSLV